MLSTVPVFVSPEPGFGIQFPNFHTGFASWDSSDLFSVIQSAFKPVETIPATAETILGSDRPRTESAEPVSNSDLPTSGSSLNQDQTNDLITTTSSGSEERTKNRTGSGMVDERKRKRMVSNRESARRSRMRKQEHLENLRSELNRLGLENGELKNRLRLVLYHTNRERTENLRLMAEHDVLRHRLSELQRILLNFLRIQQKYHHKMDPNRII